MGLQEAQSTLCYWIAEVENLGIEDDDERHAFEEDLRQNGHGGAYADELRRPAASALITALRTLTGEAVFTAEQFEGALNGSRSHRRAILQFTSKIDPRDPATWERS